MESMTTIVRWWLGVRGTTYVPNANSAHASADPVSATSDREPVAWRPAAPAGEAAASRDPEPPRKRPREAAHGHPSPLQARDGKRDHHETGQARGVRQWRARLVEAAARTQLTIQREAARRAHSDGGTPCRLCRNCCGSAPRSHPSANSSDTGKRAGARPRGTKKEQEKEITGEVREVAA